MSTVRLHCDALVSLYDTYQKDGGFATAVSALAGEEFGVALLRHYFESKGVTVEHVPGVPTTGKARGYRLDSWLSVNEKLLQIEVKNWGANAIGGRQFDGDWGAGWKQFVAWFRDPGLQKALYPMRPPAQYAHQPLIPVACMWPPMNPQGHAEPWFSVPIASLPAPAFDSPFSELYVFSMSGYLHMLGAATLDLEMPKTFSRLHSLGTLFTVDLPTRLPGSSGI